MQRLIALDPDTTTGKSKDLFASIHQKLGMVPNMMRTMGNSPAVLNGYLSLNAALEACSIGPRLGELIAVAVANANSCDYCNAAHSFIGEKLIHIAAGAIAEAREGKSADPQTQAALAFARTLLVKKGRITDTDFKAVRDAGFDDPAISEIIAHVGLNLLTNYFNNATGVTVDFPRADLVAEAAV